MDLSGIKALSVEQVYLCVRELADPSMASSERPRGNPTGDTPSKPAKVAKPRKGIGTGVRKLAFQGEHEAQGYPSSLSCGERFCECLAQSKSYPFILGRCF